MIITIFADGGSRGNPGTAGAGAIAQDARGKTLATVSAFLGLRTNNFAEYEAIILICEKLLKELPVKKVHQVVLAIHMDSELVVKQMQGVYRVKNPTLRTQHARLTKLIASFGGASFTHVPRAKNKIADRLANEAMDRGE